MAKALARPGFAGPLPPISLTDDEQPPMATLVTFWLPPLLFWQLGKAVRREAPSAGPDDDEGTAVRRIRLIGLHRARSCVSGTITLRYGFLPLADK